MRTHLFFLLVLFYSCVENQNTVTPVSSSGNLVGISKERLDLAEEDVEQLTQETSMANPLSGKGWKLVFEDHFDNAETAMSKGADPNCFSKNPVCLINWWGTEECPEFKTALADLNKCNWSVYHYYNYMDFEAPEGEGVNSFHPSMIQIKNGLLYLNAEKSFYTTRQCKKKFKDPRIGNYDNYTIECPVISGGMESRKFEGKTPGYLQEFGRFEVRAKLNHGPGSWPAHWLLPQSADENGCGWPYNGEIDIMESWANGAEHVSGTLHAGHCDKEIKLSKGFAWKAKEKFYPQLSYSQRKETFYKEFHTYAVEWDKEKIRFLVDDHYIGQITNGDMIKNKKTTRRGLPVNIPKGPFYWILNTTIYNDKENKIDFNNFAKQEHIIDYVKSYRKCNDTDPASECILPNYKNTDALCPGIREYLGDFQGRSMCEAWPNISISVARCFGKDGVIDSENKYCLLNEGNWYKARTLGEACTWPREHVGWNSGKPVCKAYPHFKIKRSNCDGNIWNDYCIWQKDGWWKARKLK